MTENSETAPTSSYIPAPLGFCCDCILQTQKGNDAVTLFQGFAVCATHLHKRHDAMQRNLRL